MLEKMILPTMRTLAQKVIPAAEVEGVATQMAKVASHADVRKGISELIAKDARLAAVQDEMHVTLGKDFLKGGMPYTKRTQMGFMDFDSNIPTNIPKPEGMHAEDLFPGVFNAIETSGADGARKEIMKRSAREMLGYQNPMSALERNVADLSDKVLLPFETVTKLGLSAVSQGSQVLTGVVRTQMRGAFKSTLASFRDPDAQMFALESGAILGNVVRDAATTLFGSGEGTQKFLNLVGFTKMDMGARVFGAVQGAGFAEFQADRLFKLFKTSKGGTAIHPDVGKIEQRLLHLGLDPRDIIAQGGRLTTDQKLLAANTVAFDVNFWGDSLSLPSYFKSPWGRVTTQFKSFAYQQSNFIKQHVIKPWVDYGDYGPALRFALLIPLGGEAIADIKALLRNKPRTSEESIRLLENISQAGGFGLVADAYMQATRGMSSLSSFVLGPAPTDALSIAQAAAEITEGNPAKAGELATRLAPGVVAAIPGMAVPAAIIAAGAPAAAETLFPGEDAPDTRERSQRDRRAER